MAYIGIRFFCPRKLLAKSRKDELLFLGAALVVFNGSFILQIIPLLTSALVINETITVIALIGSAFILSGVYIAEKGFKRFI